MTTLRMIDRSCAIERTRCEAMDRILGWAYPVLDHGFIRVIDYMGDDAAIVQMARTSYGEGTKSVNDDRGLIRYLMRHRHTSPFEGCEIKLHVKLPVFVARQWIRHRMVNVNEVSARYSVLPGEFYFPNYDRIGKQSTINKQGTGKGYSAEEAMLILDLMEDVTDRANVAYRRMVDDEGLNVAREQARIVLPLNTYTEWYWKIDLHNLLHFLKLRMDPHAQYEIRVYAEQIGTLVNGWVPAAYAAWVDYQRDAVTFSRMEMEAIREYMKQWEDYGPFMEYLNKLGLSAREIAEFQKKMGWEE